MTMIQRWQPTVRMNQAVAYGGLVYTAGQVAVECPGAGAEEQTAAILRQLDALLAEAGTDRSRILTASVYLANMGDFAAMNRAWDAWVDQDAKPARTTIEARLTEPHFTVEIGVIAAQR